MSAEQSGRLVHVMSLETAIVQPKSASTSSTRHRGRLKRDASAQATEGPGDASAPAQATEGLSDASAPAHATEGLGDASASAHATEGLRDTSAPAHATEGLGDASALAHVTEGLGDASASAPGLKAFQGFSERLVLVLVPEPCDEGFEDEPPSEPVPERFKERLVLILASETGDEGFENVGSVMISVVPVRLHSGVLRYTNCDSLSPRVMFTPCFFPLESTSLDPL
ncbi:hypothetical protein CRENBAI_021563 [Crenichthys baileyi]|uniref:Uncharacterized protein n=1 Tax=Crenichthys baileyi TaxID=28760 RepID=A0AAV9QZU6_9TELE